MTALRVLLVEDSPTDAKLVARALQSTNCEVTLERVETAKALRAALENGFWDVVLSDWSLPQFNARAALEIVKAIDVDLPFIIVSGTIGEELAIEAMRAGAHDYVLKD
ncbi:MAG: response regulator, partial [Polyangiaceae bacterium]